MHNYRQNILDLIYGSKVEKMDAIRLPGPTTDLSFLSTMFWVSLVDGTGAA
jgi:hypothetical protein